MGPRTQQKNINAPRYLPNLLISKLQKDLITSRLYPGCLDSQTLAQLNLRIMISIWKIHFTIILLEEHFTVMIWLHLLLKNQLKLFLKNCSSLGKNKILINNAYCRWPYSGLGLRILTTDINNKKIYLVFRFEQQLIKFTQCN